MKISGMTRMFAATVGAILAAVASSSLDVLVLGAENHSTALAKTNFSSKLRLVLLIFIAVGLEGTGHNYLLAVDDHLFNYNPDLV